MANRSDQHASLPRQYKRQLALTSTGDVHQDGVIRRLYIEMHAEYRRKKGRAVPIVETSDVVQD